MRFSKDGTQLQLTAVDGRRALVVLPNDPELVDILAKNGVDISGGCCPALSQAAPVVDAGRDPACADLSGPWHVDSLRIEWVRPACL